MYAIWTHLSYSLDHTHAATIKMMTIKPMIHWIFDRFLINDLIEILHDLYDDAILLPQIYATAIISQSKQSKKYPIRFPYWQKVWSSVIFIEMHTFGNRQKSHLSSVSHSNRFEIDCDRSIDSEYNTLPPKKKHINFLWNAMNCYWTITTTSYLCRLL